MNVVQELLSIVCRTKVSNRIKFVSRTIGFILNGKAKEKMHETFEEKSIVLLHEYNFKIWQGRGDFWALVRSDDIKATVITKVHNALWSFGWDIYLLRQFPYFIHNYSRINK